MMIRIQKQDSAYKACRPHPHDAWSLAPSKCHALLGILGELRVEAGHTQKFTNVYKAISQLKLTDPDYNDASWFFVVSNVKLNCKTTTHRYKIVVEPFKGVFQASIVPELDDAIDDEKVQ